MNFEVFNTVSSRTIKAARFDIIEDKLKVEDRDAVYSYVKIKPGVCVVTETEKGFVLLREYRYPIKQWSYEFAAGIIDRGETPEQVAVREVREETGFITDKITLLGEFYPSFGATDEVIYLFHAYCSRHETEEKEPTELITYELKSRREIEELIKNGEFKHGAGMAAWLRFLLK